ncbi:hypothetical protein SDC9_102896 [bioreactor metagenome]|uniref:SbsA Ig-like domain-containing protein n=1 Tax=bioreactor metagenome TaxID=1076179 RepID=A0A645ASP1_9ZZZZ|nr:Ig-like domain-containing protein [Paludibacter sp.]
MNYLKYITVILITFIVVSCANRAAGPTGGLKDTIPPVAVRYVPLDGSLNYKKKEIQVYFNENITLEKITDNVVISPPQKTPAVVKGNGKLLTVSLQDELLENTTYSILFGNAVVDLNEKNPLKNFAFSFATGSEIDTLQVSGRLINAENLEPLSGIVVGLHSNLNDSAISSIQFVRIAKTDDEGFFTIRNIKAGSYKLYALKDQSRDFIYQPGEEVAFHDSIIIPEVIVKQQSDTLWKDSVSIDTIQHSIRVSYLPDNITLKLFKENKGRQYLVKSERANNKYFNLIFNARQENFPEVTPLNFDKNTTFLVQSNQDKDSLVYWIPDSTVYKMDTLSVSIRYLKTDSLFQLVPVTDTLKLASRKPKTVLRTKTQGNEGKTLPALNVKTNLSANFDLYREISFDFEEPLDLILQEKVKLFQKVDTTFRPLKYEWIAKDSINRVFALKYPWKPQESYELRVDSAAFRSIYGSVNKSEKTPFKIKSLDEYSALKIVLENFDSLAVIQVLDTKETVVKTAKAAVKGTLFEYLKPGEYFVRLFIDENKNNIWDPGDLVSKKQPEKVVYFQKKLSLRANWELEESWNHLNPDFIYKKPAELNKTKKQ